MPPSIDLPSKSSFIVVASATMRCTDFISRYKERTRLASVCSYSLAPCFTRWNSSRRESRPAGRGTTSGPGAIMPRLKVIGDVDGESKLARSRAVVIRTMYDLRCACSVEVGAGTREAIHLEGVFEANLGPDDDQLGRPPCHPKGTFVIIRPITRPIAARIIPIFVAQ